MRMLHTLVVLVSLFCVPGLAAADPEKAYQGGKSLSQTLSGQKQEKIDDRDFEQRVRDYVREKGAEAGGAGKSDGKDKQYTSGRSESNQPRTDNPRRP